MAQTEATNKGNSGEIVIKKDHHGTQRVESKCWVLKKCCGRLLGAKKLLRKTARC